jgi:hypothetical protein
MSKLDTWMNEQEKTLLKEYGVSTLEEVEIKQNHILNQYMKAKLLKGV